MPALANCLRLGASQNFDNVIQAEAEAALLLNSQDAGEKFLRRDCPIERFTRAKAIITAVAGFVRKVLPEIAKECGPSASTSLRIMHHFAQLRPGDARF